MHAFNSKKGSKCEKCGKVIAEPKELSQSSEESNGLRDNLRCAGALKEIITGVKQRHGFPKKT